MNEFVPEEMAKYYFAAADAVVLPYGANFSRGSGVLIECCLHLRPMIASATPYFSAFLTRYPCGVSYVPGDSAWFADAARSLLAAAKSIWPPSNRRGMTIPGPPRRINTLNCMTCNAAAWTVPDEFSFDPVAIPCSMPGR